MQQKNEDSQTREGMRGNPSVMAAVLTLMSVLTFSLFSLLCLWCKRKPKIVQGQDQVYTQQTFHRGGSKFAVTRSKTVTRANQITAGETCFDVSAAAAGNQSDYENVMNAQIGNAEHPYIEPLPVMAYGHKEDSRKTNVEDESPGVYANFTDPPSQEDDDYENSDFLNKVLQKQDEEEPDYVNENGTW